MSCSVKLSMKEVLLPGGLIMFGPAHKTFIPITVSSNEGLGEPAANVQSHQSLCCLYTVNVLKFRTLSIFCSQKHFGYQC